MVRGGPFRPPYQSVQLLLTWAERNEWIIDGRLAAIGVDPTVLPWRRFLNMLAAMWIDSLWEEEDREQVLRMLSSRQENQERAAMEQESSVLAFARAAGIALPPGVR